MTRFSTSLGQVWRWLRDGEYGGSRERTAVPYLALEVGGTVRIMPAGNGRIEASIVGRIQATARHAARHCIHDDVPQVPGADHRGEISVDARCSSIAAVAASDPFASLQLFDDNGVALTYEVQLGQGVGIPYEFHARIDMPTRARPLRDTPLRRPANPGVDSERALISGLRARVVTRTYRNDQGPQYHVERLMLTLLEAGAEFPGPRPPVPQSARVPSLPCAVLRPHPAGLSAA